MEGMKDSITIVTTTRKRIPLLKRAIASVRQQDYTGPVTHMIVIDDCPETKKFLEESQESERTFLWFYLSRARGERTGPQRVAFLHNYAVQVARTKWIALLDDDNEFEANHLSSLVECAARTGYQAVHSHRKLYLPDGSPYLEERNPWYRDKEEGRREYADMCAEGILEPGSNIMKDGFAPKNSSRRISFVDTGEWLIERSLLLQYPRDTGEYSDEDWIHLTTEDDKFIACLIEHDIAVASTNLPTLKYYLGGYTNTFAAEQPLGVWANY